MKIKIKEIIPGCMPEKLEVGDWIDLKTAEDITLKPFEYKLIPLGVAMELPDGYEAYVVPRSSTFSKWGILLANSYGVIDNSYNGDTDQWGFPAYSTISVFIPKGTRICQFRIHEKQPDIEFEKVDSLGNTSRGGFGSTGD